MLLNKLIMLFLGFKGSTPSYIDTPRGRETFGSGTDVMKQVESRVSRLSARTDTREYIAYIGEKGFLLT